VIRLGCIACTEVDVGELGDVHEGLYESLLTKRLQALLLQDDTQAAELSPVEEVEQPLVLTRHLTPIIEQTLRGVHDPATRLDLVHKILAVLAEQQGLPADDLVPTHQEQVQQLLSVRTIVPVAGIAQQVPRRPVIALSDAALLTNARGEPTLAAELNAELASADGVDLLCAFVKWHGVRLLAEQLSSLRLRGIPLRVITTTYMGATDAKALDALVTDFGAEVRINYETNRTRLHAKAWLLRRNSSFDTAYVGSSNLSMAALVDGLEWNVRLSTVDTPLLIEKFRTTFDSYWESREFEPYSPKEDGDRLRAALDVAGGRRDQITMTLSGLEVNPLPYQQEMLEEIDAERTLHDRHRNLVVAATGTGKTVVAALDYRRLKEAHDRDLSLLFVAHRVEILRQSRRMYQEVLSDATFGEEWTGSAPRPTRGRHLFASIQTLSAEKIAALDPKQFDVVVVDEFHHAEAASYRRLLEHVEPMELLALTATPERGDGVDVRSFFDGRTATELRLWDALDQNLLCPFHYFGIYDGTDLERIAWKRGAYDGASLDALYTGNDARTRIVLKELAEKVTDLSRMRALGFCVSVDHARYMAARFNDAGIPARAVWAQTPPADRVDALQALKDCEINVIFAVDLFNEGLDIPGVDTVLFLRPTESATIFLQQLGRGLRMTSTKSVLTVLDFVGHQRREFRFDQRYRALTGVGGKKLEKQIEQGFPFLPSGSQIVLDVVAREIVLANVRHQVKPKWAALISEVRQHEGAGLASFLEDSGRALGDVLKSKDGRSWTVLCREAGKAIPEAGPRELPLRKRVRALSHVDDALRVNEYGRLVADEAGSASGGSALEQRLARMLFFSLYPDGGGFDSVESGLESLRPERAVRSEFGQVINLSFDLARRSTQPIVEFAPELHDVPLAVHGSYQREEILAALDHASLSRRPSAMREGVAWCESVQADALLITLKKSERDFSPSTRYKDYALSPDLFHWESQSTTTSSSRTGQRYRNHRAMGTNILLFVRESNQNEIGTAPYVFLGPADYVSDKGERPMQIVWRLRHSMPTEIYLASRAII
jgi:superfamily II DNA or RNA helicase/HKD family nuclease